jgi:hypothetical protein
MTVGKILFSSLASLEVPDRVPDLVLLMDVEEVYLVLQFERAEGRSLCSGPDVDGGWIGDVLSVLQDQSSDTVVLQLEEDMYSVACRNGGETTRRVKLDTTALGVLM